MHPNNIYKIPPDFKELAVNYPDFRKYVKLDLSGRSVIDFRDQKAVKELTRTLLKRDFDLNVEIKEDRLIPRVPLCLNYLLWIEDLLSTIKLSTTPLGIDIGTGNVCIYSLLAAKKGWKMLATEIDSNNYENAENNIKQNNFEDRISLKLVSNADSILIGAINDNLSYDFCMCNPPFFDHNEQPQNRTKRRVQLTSVASDVATEISVQGGEIAFIKKIISESQQLKEKIKIYTTLIGKKSDFISLKKEVNKICPKSIAFTEFCQGRTMRWGIAWSFLDFSLNVPQYKTKKSQKRKNKTLQISIPMSVCGSVNKAMEKVKEVLAKLEIKFEISSETNSALSFKAYKNTWSHQRKRRRLKINEIIQSNVQHFNDDIHYDDFSSHKKIKVEANDDDDDDPSTFVEGLIFLKRGCDSVELEMSPLSGNKEHLHQIFQYFKNKLGVTS